MFKWPNLARFKNCFLFAGVFLAHATFATGQDSAAFSSYQKAMKEYMEAAKSGDSARAEAAKKAYLEAKGQWEGETAPAEEVAIETEPTPTNSKNGAETKIIPPFAKKSPHTHAELIADIQNLEKLIERNNPPEIQAAALLKLSDLSLRLTGDPEKSLGYLKKYQELQLPVTPAIKMQMARLGKFQAGAKIRAAVGNYRTKANKSFSDFKTKSGWNIFGKIGGFFHYSKDVFAYHKAFREGKKLQAKVDDSEKGALGGLDGATHSYALPGHRLEILFNGNHSFKRRYEMVRAAKSYIYLQTLYYRNDVSGNATAELLIKKAREGVDVRVLIDEYSNKFLFKKDITNRLAANGVKVLYINQIFDKIGNVNHRFHQKLFIVDGVSYLAGGMNIGDEYADGGITEKGWRDSDIEIAGPSISEARELFLNNWMDAEREDGWAREKKPEAPDGVGRSGDFDMSSTNRPELFSGPVPAHFDENPIIEDADIRFVAHNPKNGQDPIEEHYIRLIQSAPSEVVLETPYFFPSKKLLGVILDFIASGKKFTLITNSLYSNDMGGTIVFASRVNLKKLVLAGGHLYEWYGKQTMHSKIGWCDAPMTTIGSYNLNSRSHKLDTECNVFSSNGELAAHFKQALDVDLNRCHLVSKEEAMAWDDELIEKVKTRGLKLFEYFY